jgi:hypothetical protein
MHPNLSRERYKSEYWPAKRTLRIPATLARTMGITPTHIVSPIINIQLKVVDDR